MRLIEVVDVSRTVGATRSRTAKVTALADVLARAEPALLPVVVAFLSGEPRQARLDVGPTAVFGVEVDPAPEPTLTVAEVDAAFQAIADTPAGAGSRTARIATLTDLLGRATTDEQDWLRRLAVRDLRQGALAGALTIAIARAADVDEAVVRRAAMLSGDLATTAVAAMTGGVDALAAFRLQVGVGLEPMLASTAASVAEAVAAATGDEGGEVVVDAKLDGARVQVHVAAGHGGDGPEVRVFTRTLREVADTMPDVVAAVRSLEVTSIVLDGEALLLGDDGRPLAFQDTMARVGRGTEVPEVAEADVPLSVRFFDLLHLDGEDVLDLPLRERRARVEEVVPPSLRVDGLVTADVAEAEAFTAATLAAGHEGVMVKASDAPYEAGRRGASWRKVKPVHTLDLVVLAAEHGSGRRRGWLSNLHLGARVDDDGPYDVEAVDGTRFVMLGKTFKGLTDATLTWQTEALQARAIERPDGYLVSDADERARHVVHVRPELVVEIALDGFVRSTRYAGGLAMRFARVRGYRSDKAPSDADTLTTARAIATGDRLPTG